MINISNDTLNILYKIKSPKLIDVLRASMMYGYDDYFNNSHNTHFEDVNGLEEFCKTLYIDWRNNLISNASSLPPEQAKVAEILQTKPLFFPENIEKQNSRTPFYNFFYRGYNKYFSGTGTRPAKLQSGKTIISDEDGMEADGFLHVYGYALEDKKEDDVNCRLYLNLIAKNTPAFALELYKKCRAKNLPFYFKFTLKDSRNDPFLLYTSYELMPTYLEIIEEIKKDKPFLFEGTENVSNKLGVLNGYIGFGDEPKIADNNGNLYSYNSLRKKLINEIRLELKDTLNKTFPEKNSKTYFTTDPKAMTFKECSDELIENYLAKNLNTPIPDEHKIVFLETIKEVFYKNLVDSIITGQPMKDTFVSLGVIGSVNLETSKINWIQKIKSYLPEHLNNLTETEIRGLLTKNIIFSTPSTSEEKRLNLIIKNALVEGLKEDLKNTKNTEIINKYLQHLDVEPSKMDSIGKSLILTSAANFIKNGTLMVKGSKDNGGYVYPDKILDVYNEFIGKDIVNTLIQKKCKNYHVSYDNLCYNTETQQYLKQKIATK